MNDNIETKSTETSELCALLYRFNNYYVMLRTGGREELAKLQETYETLMEAGSNHNFKIVDIEEPDIRTLMAEMSFVREKFNGAK